MDILTALILLLLLCWALGFGGVFAAGNAIHILLVIVLVLVVIRLLQGRSIL